MKTPASDAVLGQRSAPAAPDSTGATPQRLSPADASAAKTSVTAIAPTPATPTPAPVTSATAAPRRAAPAKRKKAAAPSPKNADAADAPGTGDDAKKRVRLKPETREQLLERLRNPPLSLHETSIILRVSRATVRRYADAGRLPCLRTPGGQRRFALRDIENFYRQLKTRR